MWNGGGGLSGLHRLHCNIFRLLGLQPLFQPRGPSPLGLRPKRRLGDSGIWPAAGWAALADTQHAAALGAGRGHGEGGEHRVGQRGGGDDGGLGGAGVDGQDGDPVKDDWPWQA